MLKPPFSMDCRIKSGNDDLRNRASTSRAKELKPAFAEPVRKAVAGYWPE
jgi:hypothetical protein